MSHQFVCVFLAVVNNAHDKDVVKSLHDARESKRKSIRKSQLDPEPLRRSVKFDSFARVGLNQIVDIIVNDPVSR